jgi:hypothetical protein
VLPAGGYLVLNVCDIKHRKGVLPLVEKTRELAIASGFVLEDTLMMPLAKLHRTTAEEPVLVFRKVGRPPLLAR